MSIVSYYILRVAPQREVRAAEELTKRGYQSFVPIEKKHQRRGDGSRTRTRKYPMFIRYAFLGCADIYQAWHHLRSDVDLWPKIIQGNGPLGMDGRPYSLKASDVAHLLSLERRSIPYGQSVNPHHAHLAVKQGDKARVLDGHYLAGHEGSVSRIVAERAHVLVQMFGSLREVPISLVNLEAVS